MKRITSLIRGFFKRKGKKKFKCYEVWRPNIPDDGCKEQCKKCAEIELQSKQDK